MDVRLNERGRHQAPLRVDLAAFRGEPRLDCGNALALDADVEGRAVAAEDTGKAENEIHGLLVMLLYSAAKPDGWRSCPAECASSARRARVTSTSTMRLSSSISPMNTTP